MLEVVFPVDTELLGAMILAKSIGMIAGMRGGGKSWLAILIAYAIAGKKTLPPWGNGAGLPTVILDGEMRSASLQKRLELIHASNKDDESRQAAEQNLHIISRDCMGVEIGSIDTIEGQRQIDALIPDGIRLIIVDNLSAWTSGGREDGNSWAGIKTWLIAKRIAGVAVLLIHHAGKNGQQRGSSAHEDLLDYSILLTPLPNSADREDTRFSVQHTKLRDNLPELRKTFEYTIWVQDQALQFEVAPAGFQVSAHDAEWLSLHEDGMSYEEIGRKYGVNKSTVSRRLKRLREELDGNDAEAE
ncbi:AAA family ATPase [Duganella sp. FT94W]|uniref:AAA family ATPase n=2 Tax=Duganella TaxID=75654 RepID=A0ABW9V5X2_9BURK|nr:AAA family ATPase [Duganella lactea]MYM34047.1 AAA family ATPase [Duganella lactea]